MNRIVQKGIRYLTNKQYRFQLNDKLGLNKWMSDEDYLKKAFWLNMGYPLDLENPQTFNEKLQWLKLYDRKPIYTTMVDKYEAKKYVADVIGEEYIIPTLGVWDKFDDIDFSVLPDQFVLKCTHDSGGVVICRSKADLNLEEARKKINQSLKRNYYWQGREWPYKDVKPRIIAEEYLYSTTGEDLTEYKVFCFGGIPKMVLVCMGAAHGNGRTNDFCDLELHRFPFTTLNPNSMVELKKPEGYEKMLELAGKASDGIPVLRVDFYIVDGNTYLGELTFFHNSGLCAFDPKEWDQRLGDWINLPNNGGR